MFGEKVKIEIEVSKNLLENSMEKLIENKMDLSKAINLFLQASIDNDTLYLPKDLLDAFTNNKKEMARDYLEGLLEKGKESFKDLAVSQEEILMFLGVL